ncbi:MAG: ABC transporter permease subunit [Pseudomonadota bacterium]
MIRFVLQRLAFAIPTLFAVVTATFFLLRLAPGGPFDGDRELAPEVRASLDARYGLDKSLPEQFISYIAGLLRGDFGPSFRYKDVAVSDIIADQLPVSLTIGALALVLAAGLGVSLGALMAARHNSWFDRTSTGVMSALIAVPSFVTAPLLALVFGVLLGWLPVGGWNAGNPLNLILPVVALGLPNAAYIARLTRASVLETLSADHVIVARAKGLSPSTVMRRHVLPPAMLPVVSYVGPIAVMVLTGSVVIEKIFGLPGTGLAFLNGALNRDYTLVMGLVVVYAGLIVLVNLLTDLAYGALNPALRVGK